MDATWAAQIRTTLAAANCTWRSRKSVLSAPVTLKNGLVPAPLKVNVEPAWL